MSIQLNGTTGVTFNDSSNTSTAKGTVITSGTSVASTSGTSIDFTGIPNWVKRITILFNGVSLSGTADHLIQLGTSGGIETTGYLAASEAVAYTAGFGIRTAVASYAVKGTMTLNLLNGNVWCMSTNTYVDGGTAVRNGAGTKTTSGAVTTVRITSTNGTDTFDAGSINILYE
jgi:hypothetical protein